MTLSLAHLRMLAAVGEWKSISRAAAELGLSQPAVSKSIRTLEREAGVQLVVAMPRGAVLTEAGETLCAHARAILSATQAAEEDLAAYRRVRRGVLRVGASTTIARYALPPVVAEFLRRHPDIEVRVTSLHSRFIARLALERQLDVALVEAPVGDERLHATPWMEDELIVVAAPGHPLADGRPTTPTALAQATWILREAGSGARAFALAGLARVGVRPARVITVDCNEVMTQLAAAGTGLAVVSATAVAAPRTDGRLRELDVPRWFLRRPFERLTVQGRRPSPLARAFEALLVSGGAGDAAESAARQDVRGTGA